MRSDYIPASVFFGLSHLTTSFSILMIFLVVVSCSGLMVRSDARSEFELGLALFNQGKYVDAIPHFEKSSELDPDFAQPYLYLGRSYLNLSRWLEAVPPLRTAFRLSPGETKKEVLHILLDAIIGAATVEFKKGNIAGSINYLKEGLELDPESVTTRNELVKNLIAFGSHLLNEGNIDEAISAFSEAVTLSPGNINALIGLAKSFFRNGDLFKSMQTIQKALDIDPENRDALTLLMELLKR